MLRLLCQHVEDLQVQIPLNELICVAEAKLVGAEDLLTEQVVSYDWQDGVFELLIDYPFASVW